MLNAIADITEPRKKESSSTLSAGVSAQEARNAIFNAFPFEGDLKVRHLWSQRGVTRYRANWFREVEGEMRIVKTLFVGITMSADGLVVRDETAV